MIHRLLFSCISRSTRSSFGRQDSQSSSPLLLIVAFGVQSLQLTVPAGTGHHLIPGGSQEDNRPRRLQHHQQQQQPHALRFYPWPDSDLIETEANHEVEILCKVGPSNPRAAVVWRLYRCPAEKRWHLPNATGSALSGGWPSGQTTKVQDRETDSESPGQLREPGDAGDEAEFDGYAKSGHRQGLRGLSLDESARHWGPRSASSAHRHNIVRLPGQKVDCLVETLKGSS
ncbi:unnamed protein product [Protopolystoma xenopodis]|uniref:Uncharacterized protein n=1 Tax=Protopolystoma xenopodis TaxID=117903 RepID=A0A448WQM5_9PLAT|nr:unnamed protein product [Protopolystoma xenopodis]